MNEVGLFVAAPFGKGENLRLLDERATASGATLFKNVPQDFAYTTFRTVDSIEDADFVLVPQSIRTFDTAAREYLESVCSQARVQGKKVLLFLSGDHAYRVHVDIPEVIVFKASEFRHSRHANEIIFAPFVEDLGATTPPSFRVKQQKPTISFCGFAGFNSYAQELKYHVTNALLDLASMVWPLAVVYKRGIYFRQRAMHALERDSRVVTNFITRTYFGANASTVKDDPETIRREYIASIVNADFVLAPKGDANYSSRFYETLSLGRIPVVIDTDMMLPFEHLINYDEFVIRVPHTNIDRVAEYVMDRYSALSDEAWQSMQQAARAAFEQYLRYDAYFNRALPLLRDGGVKAVVGKG